jgi:hypothetical protein
MAIHDPNRGNDIMLAMEQLRAEFPDVELSSNRHVPGDYLEITIRRRDSPRYHIRRIPNSVLASATARGIAHLIRGFILEATSTSKKIKQPTTGDPWVDEWIKKNGAKS